MQKSGLIVPSRRLDPPPGLRAGTEHPRAAAEIKTGSGWLNSAHNPTEDTALREHLSPFLKKAQLKP